MLRVSNPVSSSRISTPPSIRALRLLVVAVAQVAESDVAAHGDSDFVVGPMAPATKRGFCGVENSSAAWRASSRGAHVELASLLGQAELGQHDGRCLESCWFR